MKPARIKNEWTPEEIKTLREVYPAGVQQAMKAIPTRSRDAIIGKANLLHIFVMDKRYSLGSRKGKSGRDSQSQRKAAEEIMWKPQPEYIQAADIFQVGYRVANVMGVVHEYA